MTPLLEKGIALCSGGASEAAALIGLDLINFQPEITLLLVRYQQTNLVDLIRLRGRQIRDGFAALDGRKTLQRQTDLVPRTGGRLE
jgi:hypothetical protein